MESLALTFLVYAVLLSMLVVAMSAALRSFGGKKKPKKTDAKIPFVDFPPPPPVVLTPAVKTVGTLTMLWMMINALVALYWLINPSVMPMGAESFMIAIYIIIASFYGCLGGILLLAGIAQGRRMIAWGGFLFITIMILGLGFTLLLAGSPNAGVDARFAGKIGAVVVFFHLVVDGILGHAAQTVGLTAPAENIKE
jgi:hypothetical protein